MIAIKLNYNCPPGRWQTTVRWQRQDRDTIDTAAALIGMPTAAFIRSAAHQVAEQVLKLQSEHPGAAQRRRRQEAA